MIKKILVGIAVVIAVILTISLLGQKNDSDPTLLKMYGGTSQASGGGPVIEGVQPLTVNVGDTVSYKKGITVTDPTDPAPVLTVDSSAVDLSVIGTYDLIYIARNASGQETKVKTTVTVVPRSEISLEKAWKLVDEILEEIIDPKDCLQDQIQSVYDYLHMIGYVDIDFSDNYVDNAYYFLVKRMGNCHCYYAASKLMLERMGLMCIDVKNNEDARMNHYWNLVSPDGGKNWYHFDPCQWSFEDELEGNICMVTHEHLDNFSGAHGYMSHCWTAEDYPETARENFWSERQWEEYEYTTYFTVDPDYDTSWYDENEDADIHPQGEYVEPAPEEQPPAEQPPAEQPQPGTDGSGTAPAPSGSSTPGGNASSGDTGNAQPDNSTGSESGSPAPDTGASGGDSNTAPDGADAGAAPVSDQGAGPDPAA